MAGDGRVIIDIFGDDSGFRKALNGLGNTTKAGMQTVTASIGVASTALAGFGAYAVKSGAEFETSLAKASTLFGDVRVDVDNLSAQLLQVSNDTGVAAADLGNSLYNALSAGIPATEDMSEATLFLEKSAKLAKAGFTDIDTALTATAKTINAYGMSVEDADKIQKVMIQTQNKGITTVGELGASLSQVTPTAAAFGVSFEQVGAALANMTAMGTPTAQATTQLNALIAELGKAGTTGAKGLAAATAGTKYAGMGFKEMMDSGATLNELLDLMGQEAKDSGLSMVDMFSSIEAGKSALAMSGDNSAKFADNLAAMSTEADVVGDAYEKMANTLQASTERMGTSFQNLGIQVYQSNEGAIAEIAKQLADMVNDMNTSFKEGGFNGLASSMGTSLAGIVGMISEYLPQMIDSGVQMISALLQGLTENAPALANGAINIISSLVGGIVSLLPQLAQTGTDLIVQFAQGLTRSLPTMVPKAVEIISTLIQGLVGNLDQIISTGIDLLVALGEGIISAIPQLITQIPQIVISICDAINNNAGKLLLSAAKLLLDLGVGLIKAIPTLIANIPAIIEAMVKAFIAFNWLKLGATLVKGIASGLKGAASFAGNEAKNVANLIKRHIAELPAKLLQIGKNIVKGLANGIKGGAKWAVDAIKNLAGSVLTGIKDFFGIHSPSAIMRDEVGKNLALGVADGIVKNQRAATKAAADFSAGVLDAATSWVSEKQFYNDLAAKDELEFWKAIKNTAGLQAKDLAEVDKKIYTAKANASKEMFDASAAWIAKQQFYSRLSTSEEIAAWERVTAKEGLLATEREQAEQNLYTAKKKLADEQNKLYGDYQNDLTNRQSALEGFADLFDSVATKSKESGRELLKNLQSQVDAFTQWQGDIETLSDRGITDELLNELQELGPKAAGEIRALTTLSDDELKKYVELFTEKTKLASDQAKKEIGDFTLSVTVTNDPESAAVNAQTVVDATTALVDSMAQTVTDNQPKVATVTKELATCYITTVDSFREQYRNAGYRMVQGLWEGIASGKSMLINNIVWMLEEAVAAAKEAMDINSPSRVWETEIGVQMAAGAGIGFVKQMRDVSAQMQNALTAETEKMSAQVSISAAQSVSKEAAASRVETYYVNSTVEKTPIIEFKGEMAALGRMMQPHIRIEEKRKGGTLVKGNGANV